MSASKTIQQVDSLKLQHQKLCTPSACVGVINHMREKTAARKLFAARELLAPGNTQTLTASKLISKLKTK